MKPKKYRIQRMKDQAWWARGYWSINQKSAGVYSEGDSWTIWNQMKNAGDFARRIELTN